MKTNKNEIELSVTGMSCGHCEMTIKNTLEKINGVKKAKVSRKKNNAIVTFNNNTGVDISELLNAIENTGYKASLKKE